MKKFLRLAVLCLPAFALSLSAKTPKAQDSCGGPTYPCSLHQTNAELTTIPLPDRVPSMGGLFGAGSVVIPQPYDTKVIRCTDANTDPTNTRLHSYEVTDTGGDNVVSWNANQRMLRVVRMGTGSTGIVGFDPATESCTMMNPASIAPAGGQWSLNNPNVDYYQQGLTKVIKRKFDYTQPLKPPVETTLFDLATACPMMSRMKVTFTTQLVTNDDDLFSMAFGTNGDGQDTANYVVSYQMSADRCWLLNTLTGHVQRSGNSDTAVSMGRVSTFYPFTIHSMYEAPSGQLIVGIGSTCVNCPKHGPFIYSPRSTHMHLTTASPIGGHQTSGYKTFVNVTAAPKMAARTFADLNATWYMSDNAGVKFPTPQDIHLEWQNGDPNDTYPICMSQSSTGLRQPINITTPLEQEIYCVDPSDGTYIRLTPTFTSGIANGDNFRTEYAILAGGKHGYIAFSSDWEGTLGNGDGVTPSCTLGRRKTAECRSDVFIVVPH